MSNGLAQVGSWLQGGDVAIYAQRKETSPLKDPLKTVCVRVPEGVQGRVIASDIRTVEKRPGMVQKVVTWMKPGRLVL